MILDIIFFALIVLFAVLGCIRGFFKTLWSFLSWWVGLILAYLLAKVIANALMTETVANWLVGNGSLFDKIYCLVPDSLRQVHLDDIRAAIALGASEEEIRAEIAANCNGIMGLFARIIQDAICKDMYLGSALGNAGEVLALELTYQFYVVLVGIVFFIVLRITTLLLSLLFKSKLFGPVKRWGRFAGMGLGAIRGFTYACVLLLLVNYWAGSSAFMKDCVDQSKVCVPVTTWTSTVTSKMLSGSLEDNKKYNVLVTKVGARDRDALGDIIITDPEAEED